MKKNFAMVDACILGWKTNDHNLSGLKITIPKWNALQVMWAGRRVGRGGDTAGSAVMPQRLLQGCVGGT